jgi:Sugar (and other) transporter
LAGTSAAMFAMYPESIYYIFPARILAGLSHGFAFPTVLIHASEVSIPKLRGMIVSTVPFAIIVGVFTTSSSLLPVLQTRQYETDPTRSIGINGLVIVFTGLAIAAFLNRESPVFLIRKYREQEAINIMTRLRSESHETAEIRKDFNELKLMVVEDNQSSMNIFEGKNLWPLMCLIVMKTIFVASFNMPLNLIWLEAIETKVYNGVTDPSGMWLSGIRWVVMITMTFFIDLKRIKFYKISCGVSGIVLLMLVYALQTTSARFDEWTKTALAAVLFQFSSGLALSMLTDVYATESFNTKIKPLSIAVASSLEFILQIFLVASFYYLDIESSKLMECSATVMIFGVIIACFLPDTSGLSLRDARNKFNK